MGLSGNDRGCYRSEGVHTQASGNPAITLDELGVDKVLSKARLGTENERVAEIDESACADHAFLHTNCVTADGQFDVAICTSAGSVYIFSHVDSTQVAFMKHDLIWLIRGSSESEGESVTAKS